MYNLSNLTIGNHQASSGRPLGESCPSALCVPSERNHSQRLSPMQSGRALTHIYLLRPRSSIQRFPYKGPSRHSATLSVFCPFPLLVSLLLSQVSSAVRWSLICTDIPDLCLKADGGGGAGILLFCLLSVLPLVSE